MPFGYSSTFDVAEFQTLTAVGVTDPQLSTGASLTFQVVASGLGTNAVVRFEGSLDGTNYFNLNASSEDFTLTSNGTTGYFLVAPVKYVRFRLVSYTGGAPSLACTVGVV